MEQLIQRIVKALNVGASIEEIHDALAEKGWSEEDIFLAIKGAELLYNDIVALEKDRQKKSKIRRVQ